MDFKTYAEPFNSISICLSKGLGAPVGSLLLGDKDFIYKARRVRKVFGGGMRQAGIIAAGGLYALQNNFYRIKDDHSGAKKIESHLKKSASIEKVLPVETNIVVFELKDPTKVNQYISNLEEHGILTLPFGGGTIRMVTHLDIDQEDIERTCEAIDKIG